MERPAWDILEKRIRRFNSSLLNGSVYYHLTVDSFSVSDRYSRGKSRKKNLVRSAKQTRDRDSPTRHKYNFYNFGVHTLCVVVGAFTSKQRTKLARPLKRSYPFFFTHAIYR